MKLDPGPLLRQAIVYKLQTFTHRDDNVAAPRLRHCWPLQKISLQSACSCSSGLIEAQPCGNSPTYPEEKHQEEKKREKGQRDLGMLCVFRGERER
jgi:hypothetical protein